MALEIPLLCRGGSSTCVLSYLGWQLTVLLAQVPLTSDTLPPTHNHLSHLSEPNLVTSPPPPRSRTPQRTQIKSHYSFRQTESFTIWSCLPPWSHFSLLPLCDPSGGKALSLGALARVIPSAWNAFLLPCWILPCPF